LIKIINRIILQIIHVEFKSNICGDNFEVEE